MPFEQVTHIGYGQGYTHVTVGGKVKPIVDYIREIEAENLQLEDALSSMEKKGVCRCVVDRCESGD
jgi:hypothetical protein